MRMLALIVLAGCSITYEPDVGRLQPGEEPDAGVEPGGDGGTVSLGVCDDSDPNTMVSLSLHVRPILAKSPGGCMGCHGVSATSGFSVGSYESLRRGGQISGGRIIVPGKPCESVIVQKLGFAPPFGSRMPYSGPPFFTADELQVVRDWIAEGARNN